MMATEGCQLLGGGRDGLGVGHEKQWQNAFGFEKGEKADPADFG
jgi:hypothetical protein